MSRARTAIKALVERLLGSRPALTSAGWRMRGRRLVLSYHNAVASERPPELGDRSLHLPLTLFREQLDALEEARLAVVPLTAPQRVTDPPSVAITFDDACAGAVTLAVPELARRGLPATVFVAPGLLGSPAPWWDLLADPALGAVPAAVRSRVLGECAGDGSKAVALAAREGWPVQAAAAEHRIASEGELGAALGTHPGLTLGAHTWSHPNLSVLHGESLEHELRTPLRWLRERWPDRTIPWLAYPYGLESPAARTAAERVGYDGALLVTGGWNRPGGDAFARPRLNVTPGLSAAGFRSRLAGLR